jgi:hypothetical protein
LVFLKLQNAWSEQAWEGARPYETEHLFHSHLYHLEQYAENGLRNKIEQVRIKRNTIVRMEHDVHFDAITVRIMASALDYTLDRRGRIRSGSKTRPRTFSEYWTFVRSAGFAATERDSLDPDHCPNCGGDVKVNQAGDCEYCGSTISGGEFSWVLSSIEQDESYRG